MSAVTYVQRCREWITEQLEAMGTLRTANVRDLSFKGWRQNTVTVLQRIWPEDRERVERFRRVVFTPPHSRADAKLTREWFGKGIGESRSYLNSLLDVIDREGVPEPSEAGRGSDDEAMEAEVDFPMLDLSGERGATEASEAPVSASHEPGGLDVTTGYTTPDDQGATPRDPRAPAPPALNVNWKAAHADSKRREAQAPEAPPALRESDGESGREPAERPVMEIPRAPSLPQAEEPPPPRREPPARVTARGKHGRAKAKKAAPRPKLKDLLGLTEFDARAQEPVAGSARPAPPARAVTPPPLAATPPPPPPPARAVTPAPAATPPLPPPTARVETPAPAATPPAAALRAPVAATPPPPAPAVQEAPVARVETPAPVAPPAAMAPAHPDDDELDVDDEDRERATLDFMQNSPVFGVVGRPVQRRSDTTEFLDPDAVAVATLAADLGRFGVPDGMKASLVARLADVAKRLEAGDLEWALLRGAVTDAMQYPELAKRLLPILLPWLERAA